MLKEVVVFLNLKSKDPFCGGFETGLFESISEECHALTKQKQKDDKNTIVVSKQDIKESIDNILERWMSTDNQDVNDSDSSEQDFSKRILALDLTLQSEASRVQLNDNPAQKNAAS